MTEEFCNVQLRQIQYDQENKTEGAIHVNLLTELWRFYNEDKDSPINGFAVDGVENLPPSVQERLSDEQVEWLEKGGNVYTQAEVQEFIDMVDQVDGVIHRFRDSDSVSFNNQDEEALQEALDQRKPEEDSEKEDSEGDQE